MITPLLRKLCFIKGNINPPDVHISPNARRLESVLTSRDHSRWWSREIYTEQIENHVKQRKYSMPRLMLLCCMPRIQRSDDPMAFDVQSRQQGRINSSRDCGEIYLASRPVRAITRTGYMVTSSEKSIWPPKLGTLYLVISELFSRS